MAAWRGLGHKALVYQTQKPAGLIDGLQQGYLPPSNSYIPSVS